MTCSTRNNFTIFQRAVSTCLWTGLLTLGITLPGAAQIAQQSAPAAVAPAVIAPATLAYAADLPDAPGVAAQSSSSTQPQATPPASTDAEGQPHQTKRILGIIPNFRAVTADTKLPAQSPKDKFKTMIQDSFDYSSFEFAAAVAGVDYEEGSVPQFQSGGAAYGRYLWHDFADQTDENLFVEFVVPAATHEDTRYYTLGHGSILHRGLYSVSRILITRTDSGGRSFNFSEVVGSGAAAGISNLYYPSADRDWTKTGQKWVFNLGVDAASFAVREFWPDVNRAIFHQKD
jgi:hypothetical protein